MMVILLLVMVVQTFALSNFAEMEYPKMVLESFAMMVI